MSHRRRRQGSDVESIRSAQMGDLLQTMWITTRSVQYRSRDGSPRGWRPAVDVYEVDGVIHVVVELAGVNEDEVQVALESDTLVIRGERSPVCADRQRTVHEMGILYGPFEAEVYLPHAIQADSVAAVYDNGLLHVSLERVKPVEISVKRDST